MELSQIKYLGELRTEAKHMNSGQVILSDAPLDNNGKGEAFSPTDLLSTALGSCMITIMGIKARDNNINLNNTTAKVWKTMAAEPRRVSEVKIEVIINNPELNQDQKDLLENAALNCPVAKSLSTEVLQTISFNYE